MDAEFEEIVKKFFHPFFVDYEIVLDNPEVIFEPTKNYHQSFRVGSSKLIIKNRQQKSEDRFKKTAYQFKDKLYE